MCICNATQRNAYHNYILNNNFKFYIFQFFRAFNFLSVSFLSFVKESKSSYFFEWQKSKQKTISFFVKKRNKKTTPFRIHNSVFMGLLQFIENQFVIISHYEGNTRDKVGQSPSNPNFIKFSFYNLISLINKFYTKWIASLIPFVRNDRLKICNDNFNYAFSCALKNKFEIISRNENYAFDYNKYFCRNGNNRIVSSFAEGVLWERGFAKNRSNLFSGLLHFIRNDEFDGDGLFSRNDYGEKFIFGFWNNFNFGFLFNRKIKK